MDDLASTQPQKNTETYANLRDALQRKLDRDTFLHSAQVVVDNYERFSEYLREKDPDLNHALFSTFQTWATAG